MSSFAVNRVYAQVVFTSKITAAAELGASAVSDIGAALAAVLAQFTQDGTGGDAFLKRRVSMSPLAKNSSVPHSLTLTRTHTSPPLARSATSHALQQLTGLGKSASTLTSTLVAGRVWGVVRIPDSEFPVLYCTYCGFKYRMF
jgi:hypothetical protein